MSTTSLFTRVTKFVPGELGNPRENRLTEILGGVLERVPGLARTLAMLWLDPQQPNAHHRERAATASSSTHAGLAKLEDDGTPLVSTQVNVPGGFVDLELRFSGDTGARVDDVVVWVEVKHGTEPHDGQLGTYLRALDAGHLALGGVATVVLLDQRHKLPYQDETEVPVVVAQRSWEQTGREIQRFKPPDEVSAWLCQELLSYLQEENLMDPVALGPEHLTALAYAGQASKALEAICERAERHIASQFRAPDATGPRTGCYGEGYWATWGDGTWLEWHILRRGGHGPLEIRAGACTAKRAQFNPDLERQLTQGIPIGADLVVFDRWQGPKERLMRVARPQDVLVGADLDAQARSLRAGLSRRWQQPTCNAPHTSSRSARFRARERFCVEAPLLLFKAEVASLIGTDRHRPPPARGVDLPRWAPVGRPSVSRARSCIAPDTVVRSPPPPQPSRMRRPWKLSGSRFSRSTVAA